jgi:transcriptional regulator with PAS, ATPase and Fis domain
MEFLARYAWPGNIRELANSIEAAMNFTTSEVLKAEDFSLSEFGSPELHPALEGRSATPEPKREFVFA